MPCLPFPAFHLLIAAADVQGSAIPPQVTAVTTSAQQTVLTDDEIACLRDVAQGLSRSAADPVVCALVAKGMLDPDDADRHTLTPAGQHAINVTGPGMVPGIDE